LQLAFLLAFKKEMVEAVSEGKHDNQHANGLFLF
jgi:hypothetical protein